MFRKWLLAVLVFALSACQAGSFAPAAPTLTPVPTQAPTSTPTPTPAFTPEPAPEFTALQEKIAQSDSYTLMSDGSLEYQSKDGAVVVEGVTVNPQTGEMTFTQNDQTLAVDEASIAINEEGRLTFQTEGQDGQPGQEWFISGGEVVKQFPVCQIEKFRDCPIAVEDLFDGNYLRWFETLSQPFEESQLDKRPWVMTSLRILIPDPTTKREPGAVTTHMHLTAGITTMDGVNYRLVPFELPDPTDPTNPDKNIRVIGFEILNYVKGDQLGKEAPAGIIDKHSAILLTMKVPPIMADYRYLGEPPEIPLAKKTWEIMGAEKMEEIFARVQAGDVGALRELKGMPIAIHVAESEWYNR
jgi:hypothetical protein